MAEDKGKEEEKFDFTPEGEGNISLSDARILAVRTAAESPGDYGRDFREVAMVFEVVESGEDGDHYNITLSFRPQGYFDGWRGEEQFIIGRDGTIAIRQVLSFPVRKGGGFPVIPVAIGLVVVGIVAAVGAVFVMMGSGGDSVPVAVPPTETPARTETPEPTLDIYRTHPTVPFPTAKHTQVPPLTLGPTYTHRLECSPISLRADYNPPSATSAPTSSQLPRYHVPGSTGDLRLISAEAVSRFPDGIRFNLSAGSSAGIDSIRVFFRKATVAGRRTYRKMEFEPGIQVTANVMLPSGSAGDYFPPGTTIEYEFEVRDKLGSILRTHPETLVYIDNRFEWKTITDGSATVFFYGSGDIEAAHTVVDAAQQAISRITSLLGVSTTKPVRILVYKTYSELAGALPFRSQAVSEGLQTQNMAFSGEQVLLIGEAQSEQVLVDSVAFGLSQLLVGMHAGKAKNQIPSWLFSGLASYISCSLSDDYGDALRLGIFADKIKPLSYLGSFSGTPDDIIIAYGQAESVVEYLIGAYGEEKIKDLFSALKRTLNIDLALEEVYGLDQGGLDKEWRSAKGMVPLPST